LLCCITWSSFSTCKSCHCTAEGLTFSDPIHKKRARNLNLRLLSFTKKNLAAVSPFKQHFIVYPQKGFFFKEYYFKRAHVPPKGMSLSLSSKENPHSCIQEKGAKNYSS
jgi:hypothetical protein